MAQRYHLVPIERKTWNEHWPKIRQAPLLQSWEYGEAKSQTQIFRAQRFLLQNEREEAVGLLQALVGSLPIIGGVARINRGPVFLADFLDISPSREYARETMTAIRETAKHQGWHLLRMVPNLLSDEELISILAAVGFKKRNKFPVSSAVLDLSRTPGEIRAGFHGDWRNRLTKSEKINLELEIPSPASSLPFLINEYEKMQREKKFKGVPTNLIKAIANQQGGPTWNCRILYARNQGVRHGAVMVVGHGDTCTYLIGWISNEGRRLQANYFLLWQAILLFKDLGYSFFDVGGLGANTTAGVEHFKRGLEGQVYSLLGEFSYSLIPFLH
jgi:lipid II:glycine glycyltransferase (peptidoglycan interpeptide bridge formation enzyme)